MDCDKVFLGLSQIPKVLIITCIIKSVSTSDCSPPRKNFTCDCDAAILECTGIQTTVSEIQDILANSSSVLKVILKIVGLQFDPNFRFENMSITNLTLGYGLRTPPADFFGGLGSSLVSLNLQNNSIRDIDDQLLFALSSLTELFLDINELHDLNSRMFASLPSLKYLSITSNDIQVINPDVFQNLSSLHTLLLSHNNITLFENVNIKSSSLYSLKVSDCLIQGVLENNTFSDLPVLEKLDISYNELTEVKPKSLSSLKNLKFLNLSNNVIQYLQENAFAELSNLTCLDMKNNKITLIKGTSFANLLSLKYLDLSGNKLKSILCEYAVDLPLLEQFYLQNNEIETFTAGALFYTPNLKELNVTGNNLECSCQLTDIANYLIENSTMESKDLNSFLCVVRSTNATMNVTDFDNSKCVQEEPCKKITPGSSDYDDTENSSNIATITIITPTSYASSTDVVTFSISPSTETTRVTLNSVIISVPSTTTENKTVTDDVSSTSESESTTINMTTSAESSTGGIMNAKTETTTEGTDPDTTYGSSSTTILTNLSTSTTGITPSTTEISATTLDVNVRYSTSPKVNCSSLELLVGDLSSDSNITIVKNFTYDDTTFCLKWTIPGTLPRHSRCIIKYTNITGTKSENLKCPSSSNEIMLWSRNGTIYSFCLDIYAGKKRSSCAKVSEKITSAVTTAPVATISHTITEMSEQLTTHSAAFLVTYTESTTYVYTDPTSENATFESPSTENSTNGITHEAETTEISSTTNADTSSGSLSTETTTVSSTTLNSVITSVPSTTTENETLTDDVSSTSESENPTFHMASSKESSIGDITNGETETTAAEATDPGTTPDLSSTKKLATLSTTTTSITPSTTEISVTTAAVISSVSPTTETTISVTTLNSMVIPVPSATPENVTLIDDRSFTSHSKNIIIQMTTSITPLASDTAVVGVKSSEAAESRQESNYKTFVIPLICVLVLLVLIVIIIIIKNLYKKKRVSESYRIKAKKGKLERVQMEPL